MCGIVGAVANRNIVPVLLEGLRKLEYRGYDSAGLAVVVNGGLQRLRSVGRVAALSDLAATAKLTARLGIAHTRWATHGAPTEGNAHPHISKDGLAVVHNGIIENHEAMRASVFRARLPLRLRHRHGSSRAPGAPLPERDRRLVPGDASRSQRADRGLCDRRAVGEGSRHARGCTQGRPAAAGPRRNENFCASDASALLQVTRESSTSRKATSWSCAPAARILDAAGGRFSERSMRASCRPMRSSSGSTGTTCRRRSSSSPAPSPRRSRWSPARVPWVRSCSASMPRRCCARTTPSLVLACGTSYHAGLVARYWLEAIAGIPCNVEVASEYRYRRACRIRKRSS